MKQTTFIFILLMIVSPDLRAQDVKVITGATLIDGAGRAPVKDSVIVIEGARIRQAGGESEVKIPKRHHLAARPRKVFDPGLRRYAQSPPRRVFKSQSDYLPEPS